MVSIKIFDVDHGFCAAVEANDRHTLLIGCGYSFRNGFRPARYVLSRCSRHLDGLILPTYTADHLAGFSDLNGHFLEHYFSVDYLVVNPSINSSSIPELKARNPLIGKALSSLEKVNCQSKEITQSIQWKNASLAFFWNSYPTFLDLHNLSLVTFLSYQDIHIIFPGDLQASGWRALLQNPAFCDRLRRVNLFIASKSGQEDGYCPEVFDYCQPDLVIISNHIHRQPPNSVLRQYERHARGLKAIFGKRKVLTTRDAGTITIQQDENKSLEMIFQKHEVYQYQTF